MKREGRQRGMVKTHPIVPAPWNPRPNPPSQNGLDSAPTAGHFTKVSTKPTNHSKFTGKCGRSMCRECHSNPASKSKDKAKGAQRLRSSSDVVSNHRLITWRVVDGAPGMRLVPGFSGTSVLDYLDSDDDCMDRCYGDDDEEEIVECDAKKNEIDGDEINEENQEIVESCESKKKNEIDGDDNEEYEDEMSFCDVGLFWQLVNGDDEDWQLV